MNKWLKGWNIFIFSIGGIVVLLIFGIVLLLFYFRESLIPDEKEEEKVVAQAEQYIQEQYPNMKYEVSHVLYDSGEQYGNFDYAAVILNTETKKSFMVYENQYTEQIEDNIAIQKATEFIEQVKPKISSYINETFGGAKGIAFTPSYDIGGTPTLNIELSNKKEEINEEMLLSIIDYLQHELTIEHAHVAIMYDNEIWLKEF